MKVVIWILAFVALMGCESRPLDTQRLDSSGDDVSRELATAVRRALAAKSVEDNRLVQYGVEIGLVWTCWLTRYVIVVTRHTIFLDRMAKGPKTLVV